MSAVLGFPIYEALLFMPFWEQNELRSEIDCKSNPGN